MINDCIEPEHRVGTATTLELGDADGLTQEHRSWDRYGFRCGKTLVLSDADQRLIFEVSYLENYEDQLKPVFDRVLSSLTFVENDEVGG